MKITSLNDTMIALMSSEDKRRLGVQSSDEAQNKFIARSERELQNQIAQLLRIRGVWFYQARMDKKTTSALGTPDFLLSLDGVPVALEAKFAKGKLSPEQETAHKAMAKNGWNIFTVRALDEVRAVLDQFISMK